MSAKVTCFYLKVKQCSISPVLRRLHFLAIHTRCMQCSRSRCLCIVQQSLDLS